jgi:Tol biopolymer transport system component
MRADTSGRWQIWRSCADLSDQRQLTDLDDRSSGWAVLAPDGSRIAFDSDREDPDLDDDDVINDVFTMDPDGGGVRKLTDSMGASSDPAWSSDGSHLAYSADPGGDPAAQGIFVMAADGSGQTRVTQVPDGNTLDLAPRFAPDGSQLVFTREVTNAAGEAVSSLNLVAVDGSGLHAITAGTLQPGDATWSPDGRLIVVEAYPPEHPVGSVWSVKPDGSALTDLTAGVADADTGFADPVFSPDGSMILTLHDSGGGARFGLAVMRPDGSDITFVDAGHGAEHQPDWSGHAC